MVHEERVEQICDLFFVCEVKCPFERDPGLTSLAVWHFPFELDLPAALQVHRANLDHVSRLLGLEDAVSPAAGHPCHGQEFGPVDEMVVLPARNTYTLSIYFETKGAFVLPKSDGDPGFHTKQRYLPGCVEWHRIG